jgi:hypothetical protein
VTGSTWRLVGQRVRSVRVCVMLGCSWTFLVLWGKGLCLASGCGNALNPRAQIWREYVCLRVVGVGKEVYKGRKSIVL